MGLENISLLTSLGSISSMGRVVSCVIRLEEWTGPQEKSHQC